MPNWVINHVEMVGSEKAVEKAMNSMLNADNEVDFERIVKVPKSIKATPSLSGSTVTEAKDLLYYANSKGKDVMKMIDEDKLPAEWAKKKQEWEEERERCRTNEMWKDLYKHSYNEILKIYITALLETGSLDWYEWNCKHWGTKWNANDTCTVSDNEIEFQTAWCPPDPVFEALAKKNKSVRFIVTSSNEDWSEPVETVEYVWNSKTKTVNVLRYSEPKMSYAELWGYDPESED